MALIDRLSERRLEQISGFKLRTLRVIHRRSSTNATSTRFAKIIGEIPDRYKKVDEIGEKKRYWPLLKREMRIFLCTKSKKYADIKRKLNSAHTKSQTMVVSLIAAGLASTIG